ncbi:MAG: methyltransferase domain-containing protein [Burkholderiaceae bacterium]
MNAAMRPGRLRRLGAQCWVTLALLAGSAAGALATEEVPFITTPNRVALAMLEIANVGPSDTLIDLGSGDGRIVILAAGRFGARGLGVEIDPDLVRRSRRNAERAGVAKRVEFREQDLFSTDLSGASVITMYLLPDVNLRLRPKLLGLTPGTRIVSHDWDMGDWLPDRSVTIAVPDKAVGLDKSSRVHLWVVPARVDGLWCGLGRSRGTSLRIAQHHQRFTAQLGGVPELQAFEGRIDAATLVAAQQGGQGPGEVQWELRGDRLHVIRSLGRYAPLAAIAFGRAGPAGCTRKP